MKKKTSNTTEMANGFNDFFSNIAGNINSSTPKTYVFSPSLIFKIIPILILNLVHLVKRKLLKLLNHWETKRL